MTSKQQQKSMSDVFTKRVQCQKLWMPDANNWNCAAYTIKYVPESIKGDNGLNYWQGTAIRKV